MGAPDAGNDKGWTLKRQIIAFEQLTFGIELPGIKPEDVEVTDGVLTIHGERKEERRDGEEWRYYLIERE